MKKPMKVEDWIKGIFATALALVAISVFAKVIWKGWDTLISRLVAQGYPPEIEYLIGVMLFVVAVWFGLVQLKKFKKK